MKKWLLRIVYAALVLFPIGAIADYNATPGSGAVVFAFVCSTTKICPATVLMDSTNVEKATAANPLRTDPTGTTTQPISAASGADVSEGAITDTVCAATGNVTVTGCLRSIAQSALAALPAQSNTTTNIGAVSGVVNVTPTDCSGTVTAGGTAQSPISASATIHGFTIANVDASAGSGEPIWVSFTGTASAANGSYPLAPPAATTFAANGSYTTPVGFGTNHAVSIFAATTGHKFSCTTW
jgi:hypothetical protein